jgi:predicted outer membrane repeat protein
MRENGLNALMGRKFTITTNSRHGLAVCVGLKVRNILNQMFHAQAGGQKRVSSYQRYAVTYLRTASGWVYLTVVLDLFDRKVIGWALSADMEAIPALDMATGNRMPQTGLIFYSGRGVQYCAKSFREKLSGRCPSVRDDFLSVKVFIPQHPVDSLSLQGREVHYLAVFCLQPYNGDMKRRIFTAWFAGTAFFLSAAAGTAQTTAAGLPSAYYVWASGDDENDGINEKTPFRTLGRAMEATGAGAVKTIIVIGELNEESESAARSGRSRDSVFYINGSGGSEVTIRGFDRRAELSARGSGKRVIRFEGGAKIRLENITVIGGRAENGGGGFIDGAALTLGDGAVVRGNRAVIDGGGFILRSGTLTVSGTAEIRNNRAGDDGGGVYASSGTFILSGNSRIENNLADCGGGLCIDSGSSLTLEDHPLVRGNKAAGPQGTGGGLCVGVNSAIVMRGGSVIDNKARRGAGLYNAWGAFTLENGTVIGNIARDRGGGIYAEQGRAVLNAGTIGVNRAGFGGGVYAGSGFTRSAGVTISGNLPEDVRQSE